MERIWGFLMSTDLIATPYGHAPDLSGRQDDSVIDLYLSRKATRSPATAAKYRAELGRFRAAVKKPLGTVSIADLQSYVTARYAAGASANASQALIIAILRGFFRFCRSIGYIPFNPADLLEAPRTPPTTDLRWCNAEELASILKASPGVSDKAPLLCTVLALTGLRISEAAGIRWNAFFRDPYGNVGLRVVGKGNKARSIKIRDDLFILIQQWRAEHSLPAQPAGQDDTPLFPNRQGKPCSTGYLRRLVKNTVRASTVLKDVTPHWFRHSNATLALAGGADLLQVQRDLGHESLETTRRYLHVALGLRHGSGDFVPVDVPGIVHDQERNGPS